MSLQQSDEMNNCCIIQVSNISPSCTSMQVETLFSILGRIEEMHLYPKEESSVVPCRSCCIRYSTPAEARLATHLTNTVFIDRTLTVGHPRFETLASEKQINYSELMSPENHRYESKGDSPPFSSNSDPTMQDEIRRTIYVGNLAHETTAEQVMKFFVGCGEIKFVRMAGDQSQMTRFAFVEFTDPNSISRAIQMNGAIFGDRAIKVNYSKKAIVKPISSSRLDPFSKENDALRRVEAASRFISTAVGSHEEKRRSRSRSHDRKRPSHHKEHHSRSPSYHSRRSPGDFRSDGYSRSRSPRERRVRSRSPRHVDVSRTSERARDRGERKTHRSSQSPRSTDRRNGGHYSREEKKHSSKHSHGHRKEGKTERSESKSKKGRDSPSHKHKSKSKHSKKHKHRTEERSPVSKKRSKRHESYSDLEF